MGALRTIDQRAERRQYAEKGPGGTGRRSLALHGSPVQAATGALGNIGEASAGGLTSACDRGAADREGQAQQ